MKILNSSQMRLLDKATMEIQGISSAELMERAAEKLTEEIIKGRDLSSRFMIFCGSGNNGGDGLCIARMLYGYGFDDITCCLIKDSKHFSDDNILNFDKIKQISGIKTVEINSENDIPLPQGNVIIIDAIFGTGLNREIQGLSAKVIERINSLTNEVIAIDTPSGLSDFTKVSSTTIKATKTLTIHTPQVSMLLPENEEITGEVKIIDIGLDKNFSENSESFYNLVLEEEIASKIKKRKKFSHKGTFGHSLLILGSYGKAGAAILASRACHRAGSGLVTLHTGKKLVEIIQISTPETMISIDKNERIISTLPDIEKYSAIGIGPGIRKYKLTAEVVKELLLKAKQPLVLDADALNIISENNFHKLIPKNSILTPHLKEFERLFGKMENSVKRLEVLREKAIELGIIIVLKGAYTATATPQGEIFFNTTGNPGMATAGSGDVLTGIITGLLSQKYPQETAAILGVYLHGLSGDIAEEKLAQCGLLASDIIESIPFAYKKIQNS